jgi:hypothetical protein
VSLALLIWQLYARRSETLDSIAAGDLRSRVTAPAAALASIPRSPQA